MKHRLPVAWFLIAIAPQVAAFAPARDNSAPPQPAATVAKPAAPARPAASAIRATPSSPAAQTDAELVTLNFVNADIDSVVKAVSEITGKNFVVDPRVKGTVNIVSARPMSKSLVYDVFLSALRLQGFAAVEDRGVIKLLPESDAKLQAGPTLGPLEKSRSSGDQIQTRVFTLKYESAAQMIQVLRPLIAPNNTITAYPNNNTLVITDFASNLRRVEKIIDSIDQPSGTEPIMIPLNYASALDVAQTVNRLFAESGGGTDGSQRISIEADTRSNSLLARSDNPSRLTRLRGLVAMLDTPTSAAGNIHVVHLKNAEAVKVAETLRSIFGGGSAASNTQTNTSTISASASGTSPATAPLNNASSASTSYSGQGGQPGFIQADAATNSIIITAPDAIYNNLRSVLDKLDARRAQVYVEALIAEVTADKAAEFGIQWQNLTNATGNSTSSKVFGGTNFSNIPGKIFDVAKNPATAGAGLNVGVVKGKVNIPGVGEVLNLGVLIRALESDTSANILSTPTLLTLDNEEARIVVGQNVPFITGSYANTGVNNGSANPFQTIERKDVGLTLKIKPQISEGGVVRLQIYQEVSSVQDGTANNNAGVITNKRSIESTVLVDDGQIVAIGGLIQDQVKDGVDKTPLLGDIPLLGSLFQSKKRSHNKTNLMVFLRPVVLRDAEQINSLTSQRYEQTIGEQRKVKPDYSIVLPNFDPPTLPPLQQPVQPPVPGPQTE